MIRNFRKKPVVIQAVLWSGREDDLDEVLSFIEFDTLPSDDVHVEPGVGYTPAHGTLDIPTLEGVMTASPGDWIIKGVNGEFYPCKPDIFEKTYEEVWARRSDALVRLMPPTDFKTAIFYATQEAGIMQVMWGGEAEYAQMLERGYVESYIMDPPLQTDLVFVALAKVEKNFDFRLGRSRP